MKNQRLSVVLFAVFAIVLLSVACNRQFSAVSADSSAQPSVAEKPQTLPFDGAKKGETHAEATSLPTGTTIAVRLQDSLSSASASVGQQFEAVLDEPLIMQGKTVAPKGAQVTGRVIAAHHSGRLHNPGYLRLTLTSVEINGKPAPVQTSSVFAKGGSHEKRNLGLIGGGTGGGALIGAIAGGGKGALIGAGAGAAAGTGTAYATGKKDVGFASERRLIFRLSQPLQIG